MKVAIVGAGPCGLAIVLRLAREASSKSCAPPGSASRQRALRLLSQIVIIDSSGGFMALWRRKLGSQGVHHLRSPTFVHPHASRVLDDALYTFSTAQRRRSELHPLPQGTPHGSQGLWHAPSTELFDDFCEMALEEALDIDPSIAERVIPAYVEDVHALPPASGAGFELRLRGVLDGGPQHLLASHVILAVGDGAMPRWPAWAAEAAISQPAPPHRLAHASELAWHHPAPPMRPWLHRATNETPSAQLGTSQAAGSAADLAALTRPGPEDGSGEYAARRPKAAPWHAGSAHAHLSLSLLSVSVPRACARTVRLLLRRVFVGVYKWLVASFVASLMGRARWAWVLQMANRLSARSAPASAPALALQPPSAPDAYDEPSALAKHASSTLTDACNEPTASAPNRGVARRTAGIRRDSMGAGRLLIVGAGLSGAQLALEALRLGWRSVTLLCRGGMVVRPFDISCEWMGRHLTREVRARTALGRHLCTCAA